MRRISRAWSKAGAALAVVAAVFAAPQAQAQRDWPSVFLTQYPQAGTTLTAAANNCSLCHTSVPALNPYGQSIQPANDSTIQERLTAVEGTNSDGDNDGTNECDNITEINNDTLPGDPASTPATCGEPPTNEAPAANDDSATTPHDAAVVVDVLANDTDDGQPVPPGAISINSFDSVSVNGGTVDCGSTTECIYEPPAGFTGSDSFTYDVTDGGLVSTLRATVTIDVTNTAPEANDDAGGTEENVPVTIDVLANDVDADGDAIEINTFDATTANGGTVTCNGDCSYNPPAAFTGDDTFTYDISDGIATSNRAIVTITVTAGPDVEPPVVEDPGPQTNSEDDAVSLQIVATDNVGVTNYLATGLPPGLDIDAAGLISGTVSFDAVAHPNLSEIYTVEVTVADAAGNTASTVFDWTVNDVNRLPDAVDDAASTSADTLVTIDVLANDSDPDGDPLTISAFDAASTNGGTVNCMATCEYQPPAGFTGEDAFTYTIEDGFGGSATATVTVDVAPTVAADLDIKKLKVTKQVRLDKVKPVRIELTVKNNGAVEGDASATIVGEQNGGVVYNETLTVTDPVGNGQMKAAFPSFTPTMTGDITWTATIVDGDPEADTAMSTTTVR